MRYKFPKIENELVYVLPYIYQEKEIFDNLFRENILKSISTCNGKNIIINIDSLRDTSGKLRHEKINNNGSISHTNVRYGDEEIEVVNNSLDISILYKFTPSGTLIYEEHRFKYDRPSVYHFSTNEDGFLDGINEYQIIRSDGQIKSIINRENDSVIVDVKLIGCDFIEFIDYEKIAKRYCFENNYLIAIYINKDLKYKYDHLDNGKSVNSYRVDKNGGSHLEIKRVLEYNIFELKETTIFYRDKLIDRKVVKIDKYCKYQIDDDLNRIDQILEGDYLSNEVNEGFDYKSNFSNWIGYGPTKGKIRLSIKLKNGIAQYEVKIPIGTPGEKGEYRIKFGSLYQVEDYLIFSGTEMDERTLFSIDKDRLKIRLFDKQLEFYKLNAQNTAPPPTG